MLQRQEEHFLLMFLGRFSRPRSGILIGSSEEEREAVTRGINWKRQKRAENNISGEGKAGGLCGSSKEGAKLGTPWPDLVLVKDQLRGEGRMVVGVAPQGPPQVGGGISGTGLLGARYLHSRGCLLHFLNEETEAQRGEPCPANGGQ